MGRPRHRQVGEADLLEADRYLAGRHVRHRLVPVSLGEIVMNIVADTMHGTMFFNTKTELRDHLRRQFGTGHFRLTKDGHIDVYAVMPNTHITGWWRFGDWRSLQIKEASK